MEIFRRERSGHPRKARECLLGPAADRRCFASGIDACPMEGIEPAKYDEILGLEKQGLTTVVVATAGYRAATDKYASLKKVPFPREEVVAVV